MTNVNKNINTLDTIEIDSLKLRIPYDQVKVIDYRFEDTLNSYWESTGEAKESTKPEQLKTNVQDDIGNDIYNYKWSLVKQTLERGRTNKYLKIEVTSKALEQYYFKGISKHTLRFLYRQLMNEKKVHFSFETFLNADCTDIDFKKDIVNQHFKKAVKTLNEMSKPFRQYSKGSKVFRKKHNSGIQWSDRHSASPSNPFLKLYDKYLMSTVETKNSKQPAMRHFYNYHIKGGVDDIQYRVRIEFSVKDKKHLASFGIMTQKLKDLVLLTQEKKNEMLEDVVKLHLLPRVVKVQKPSTDLRPNEMMLYKAMCYMSELSLMGRDLIIKKLVEDVNPKSRKSEAKKKLEDLWDTYIQMRTKAKENESLTHLFSALCWR